MNIHLLFIGALLLAFGYVIGVQQKIGLLTFLRHRHVRDKQKVEHIMGGSQIILGALLISLGALNVAEEPIILAAVLILLLVSTFVMKRFTQ